MPAEGLRPHLRSCFKRRPVGKSTFVRRSLPSSKAVSGIRTVGGQKRMEIPLVRVFCRTTIGPLDATVVRAAIEERLAILTYLLCPDHEEEPDDILARMRVESADDNLLQIRYRPRSRYPLRVIRYTGESHNEQSDMARLGLSSYPEDKTILAREILHASIESIGFALAPVDRDGMGWPLAISAAAKMAELGDGAIDTNDFGWFVPDGKEVRWIVEPCNGDLT